MQTWQRFTAITTGVLALHGATLWALQAYRLQTDRLDKAPALLTRLVELPKLPEVKPPPPPPPLPPPPPPKPVAKPVQPSAAPQPAAPPPPATLPPSLPLAVNTPNPAPNAPTGSANPAPAATAPAPAAPPPQLAAAPAPPAPVEPPKPPTPPPAPPAPAPVVQQPYIDADHADNQYRASYPRISQRLREEGRVVIKVMVGADGKPTSASVAKSSGYAALDEAGKETVMRWRYKPGTRGGVSEAGSVLVPVDFKLPE